MCSNKERSTCSPALAPSRRGNTTAIYRPSRSCAWFEVFSRWGEAVEYAVQLSSGDWPGWHYHKRGSSLWRVLPRATKVANQLRIYASVLQISIESIHHRGSGTISTYRDADVPANTRSSLTNSTAEADVRNRWIGQVLAMSFPRCHLLC